MGVQISEDQLNMLNMTAAELLIELAVHFYDMGKMTMGQARKFAGIDQISFQKEMQKRGVYIKYDIEDLEEDLRTLNLIQKIQQ